MSASREGPSADRPGILTDDGLFEFPRAASFTSKYLETFYRDKPPTNDERAVLGFLVEHLRTATLGTALLEVGCGPTIHHALPFVPHVSEIHMADYLPENLAAIDRWRAGAPDALDWTHYGRLVLQLEEGASTDEAIAMREAMARSKISRLLPCDLKQELILGVDVTYPAVAAFYCTEEVGITIPAWERVMAHLARVVAPGGHLYLACLRDTSAYLVGDAMYPCARIAESDVRRVLPVLGFDMDRSVIRETAVADQEREGLFGVILVAAAKRP